MEYQDGYCTGCGRYDVVIETESGLCGPCHEGRAEYDDRDIEITCLKERVTELEHSLKRILESTNAEVQQLAIESGTYRIRAHTAERERDNSFHHGEGFMAGHLPCDKHAREYGYWHVGEYDDLGCLFCEIVRLRERGTRLTGLTEVQAKALERSASDDSRLRDRIVDLTSRQDATLAHIAELERKQTAHPVWRVFLDILRTYAFAEWSVNRGSITTFKMRQTAMSWLAEPIFHVVLIGSLTPAHVADLKHTPPLESNNDKESEG